MQDQELHGLGNEIAKHLGADWVVDQQYVWLVKLVHLNGRILNMRLDGKRLVFTGVYPQTSRSNKTYRRTFNPDRNPAIIAAELQRWLLPDYAIELAKVFDYNEREKRDANWRMASQKTLVEAIPGASVPNHLPELIMFYGTNGISRGEIRLNHDGASGDMELRSVPLRVLLALALTIAKQPD